MEGKAHFGGKGGVLVLTVPSPIALVSDHDKETVT